MHEKVVKKASSPALREGIQMHIEETQTQIERVEQAMEHLDARRGRKVCEAMRGLVEELDTKLKSRMEKVPFSTWSLWLECSASNTTKSPPTERTLRWRKRSVNRK